MGLIKYDHTMEHRPFLTEEDKCYYFLNYNDLGFKYSESNQTVFNFKKDISKANIPHEWQYRNLAIEKFVKYLSESINWIHQGQATVIPAHTSKPRASSSFNNRIDLVVDKLSFQYPTFISVEKILDAQCEVLAAHCGGERNLNAIKSNLLVSNFQKAPSSIVILIDDVLTTGSHFRACKDMILAHDSRVKDVIGIFLALYSRSTPDEIFQIL